MIDGISGVEFHSIIENVFGGDVNGINQSEQLQVNCPRCQERDGLSYPDGKYNLEINTQKRIFRCWKCEDPRFSGKLGRLIRIYGNNVDYEMYKSYASILGSVDWDNKEKDYVPVTLPNEMVYFSQADLDDPEHFEAYNYLVNERQISRDIILKFRLGFCLTGKYAKKIIIPSFDADGEVNYFVARNYGKGKKRKPYDNPKDSNKNIIFNDGYLNWDGTIYIVEGVFEMFSFPVNTTPILGKEIPEALYTKLKQNKPNVVVLFDPDAFEDMLKTFYLLQTAYIGYEDRVKLMELPQKENLDLDEIRKKYGKEKVVEYLYNVRDVSIDDYFRIRLHNPYEYKTKRLGL